MQLSLSCHARQVCLRRLITGFSDVIKLSDVTNLLAVIKRHPTCLCVHFVHRTLKYESKIKKVWLLI